MNRLSPLLAFRVFPMVLAICLTGLALSAMAHETEQKTPDPGFRPQSEYAPAFLDALDTATVAVFPSIVRRADRTAHSFVSQQQIIALLNESNVVTAVAASTRIDLGTLKRQSQWDTFENGMQVIVETLKSQTNHADYNLFMEFLVPDNLSVFGIQCYILDDQGQNAFSFLLNSHHQMFADANLVADRSSEAARAKLIESATQLGVTALLQQIKSPDRQRSSGSEGYSIIAQKVSTVDKKVERVFVITRLHERLIDIFMHSFKHSLISAFESNGVDAIVKFASRESDALAEFGDAVKTYGPDATILIDIDPLYRKRKDGYKAVVGTNFKVILINKSTGQTTWHATGKVDYIKMFGRKYVAHEGIRKEFAWHTTAAIVRAFMADLYGQETAPIYTVTEERQRHGQRTD